jgi:hypothetical protein
MGEEFLGERKRALEEAFFARENERLRQRLIDADTDRSRKAALAAASGITDEKVLDRLAGLGLGTDTLAALALVPLVAVAWADGSIDRTERAAVLDAAKQAGIGGQGAGQELLDRWLGERPPAALLDAWMDYTRAICAGLGTSERAALRDELLGRARRVAEATGGFLGLSSPISDAEAAVLAKLEGAFAG